MTCLACNMLKRGRRFALPPFLLPVRRRCHRELIIEAEGRNVSRATLYLAQPKCQSSDLVFGTAEMSVE